MAEDDDQRQSERVSSRAVPEVEIPRPEAREDMDVGEPTVRVAGPVEDQPVPTVRVGGSSSSGPRAGSGSRANETITDDRDTKRVRFTESRGQKRQGEDVEELATKAEEQHLDADVEVPAHKTWRVEDVVGDAADAAPERMNSFAQSKTEVFEKIEESLRPLCMVEDLNDDEIMELCILSNELNACTAILDPSKFASCATRLGLREEFAVDLITARANGTIWELSLEDDRAELRRVQNREQPELLAGSPPSDDFVCGITRNQQVENRENGATDKNLCTRLTSCRWQCRSTSFMNILKIPRAGEYLRFNPLSATREYIALMVRCVPGV